MTAVQDLVDNIERRNKLVRTGLRVGAHFAPGGKHCLQSLAQAIDAPATAMQLFAGNPHRYWSNNVAEEDREAFIEGTRNMYVMVHSVYITNLGENPDGQFGRNHAMTQHSLVNQLEWADWMGCDAFVFHPGSAKDADMKDALDWTELGLRNVLARYGPGISEEYQKGNRMRGDVKLCLENSAGDKRGRKIGQNMDDLITVIRRIGDPRLRVVVDTTHAFAAGYSVDQIIHWVQTYDDLVEAIHFNTPDPQVTQGSFTDRHSSAFPDGAFSMEELSRLYTAFRHKPLILEGCAPWFSQDLAWMLRWELELRDFGEVRSNKMTKSLGDIFDL